MPTLLSLFSILILVFSVIVHEVSHGLMADALGDPTPRLQGRLTLNPLKHLDPFGSILVPILTSFAGFTFGWAKPVIYNPYNIKNKRQGELLIALAGPASNLVIAFLCSMFIRYAVVAGLSSAAIEISIHIVIINIVLAMFNLIPLPPLDGSKVLFVLLPHQYGKLRMTLELYAPIFLFFVVFFLWNIVSPLIGVVFHLFTGI